MAITTNSVIKNDSLDTAGLAAVWSRFPGDVERVTHCFWSSERWVAMDCSVSFSAS